MVQTFQERCLQFSVNVMAVASHLPRSAEGRHVEDQLLRSGTSVGANVHEARGAESRADFIHKMQIALKESRETFFWLSVIGSRRLIDDPALPALIKECNELTAILAKSVITARKNGKA